MKLTDFVTLTPPTPKSVKVCPRYYWRANIGGVVEATGDDAEATVKRLKTLIERAFEGDYSPRIVMFRGYLGISWRTTHMWAYKITDPEGLLKSEGTLTPLRGCSSYPVEDEIHKHLRSDMAQRAWNGEEEQSPIIEDKEDQKAFISWARWQKRYKQLQATGLDDTAIREQLFRESI